MPVFVLFQLKRIVIGAIFPPAISSALISYSCFFCFNRSYLSIYISFILHPKKMIFNVSFSISLMVDIPTRTCAVKSACFLCSFVSCISICFVGYLFCNSSLSFVTKEYSLFKSVIFLYIYIVAFISP